MTNLTIKQFLDGVHKFLLEHPRVRVQFSAFLDEGAAYRMRTSTWDVWLVPERWRMELKDMPEMSPFEWGEFNTEWMREHVPLPLGGFDGSRTQGDRR